MDPHVVAEADELEEGSRLVTLLQGREIAVFNIKGEYYAYTNWCAHQSGPVCEGYLDGTQIAEVDEDGNVSVEWDEDEQYITCPWHGFEFDVTTGECISRSTFQLVSHPVKVEEGEIIVLI